MSYNIIHMKGLLLLLLLGVAACLSLTLPYQAHSFNDLDIFVQFLKKGVRVFKMDLSFTSQQSCVNQSTWKKTDNDCFYVDAYAEEICCLAFRGDASATPEYRYPFNTTAEFLKVLERPELQEILREKIFLAINFMYKDSQNAITKSFLFNLLKTIESRKLGITLATGSDNIILDYDYKCVIQGKCDEVSRYISNSSIVLQSTDANPYHPHDAKKRYRNFNAHYMSVEKFCKDGFPEWVDKYDYPIIFWEPSSELQIQFVLSTFLSSSCKRPAKHNSVKQLALASNLEPEMFNIYAQGVNNDWGFGKKLLLNQSSSPMLTTLVVSGISHLLLGYLNLTQGLWIIELRNSSAPDQVINSITLQGKLISMEGYNDTLAVCQFTDKKMLQLYNNSLLCTGEMQTPVGSYNSIGYYHGLIHTVVQVKNNSYNWMTVDVPAKKLIFTDCPLSFEPIDLVMLDTLYIVGSKKGHTYLSVNCTKEYQLSYGTSAKVASSSNLLYILQANGMCQSGVMMNNNEINKCQLHKYPEFDSMKEVPYLHSYIAGSLSSIVEETEKQAFSPIGACSSKVASAKLMNGWNATLAVIDHRVYLASMYVPISKQPIITSIFCGGSNPQNIRDRSLIQLSYFDSPVISKESSLKTEKDHHFYWRKRPLFAPS